MRRDFGVHIRAMRMVLVLVVILVASGASAAPWVWQRGGTYINDLAAGSDGAVAVFTDGTLVLLGPDGKLRKEYKLGPRALVRSLAFAPDKDLVVTGYFRKELVLATKRFSTKDQAGFVARFSPAGVLRWAVHVESDDVLYMTGVAAIADRVIATGWSRRGTGRVGKHKFNAGAGFVVVLDAAGQALAVPTIDLGFEGELRKVCATKESFVVIGFDRRNQERGYVAGLTKAGKVTWSHTIDEKATTVACRAGGTSYVGVYEDDLVVYELDRAGKQVRKLSVATDIRDQPLHLSLSKTELAVSSRHSDGKRPLWSRVSRFALATGKLLGSEDYKGDESIYMHATYGPAGLILVGEVTRGAKLTLRGRDLTGPMIVVSAP